MNSIVIIDTDLSFRDRFQKKLEKEGITDRYRLVPLVPDTALEPRELIQKCLISLGQIIATESNVIGIFIDIVIFEGNRKIDRTGLDVAAATRRQFPNTPIVSITGKYFDEESETDMVSEATLEDVDGVISKSFLVGKYFSAGRLLLIFEKTGAKRRKHTRNGTDFGTGNRSTFDPSTDHDQASPLPRLATDSYNSASLDPRVEAQINEIGPIEFWSLLTKILPNSQGIVSFIRPGRSGAFVFRVLSKFDEPNMSVTRPKPWLVKISNDIDSLETELSNYRALAKTPLPRSFFPKPMDHELSKVGNLGGFAIELEAGARTLIERWTDLTGEERTLFLQGIQTFLADTYGEPKKRISLVWREWYRLNANSKLSVLSALHELAPLLGNNNGPLENVLQFVATDGAAVESVFSYELDAADMRTVHGDFNSRNLLLGDGSQFCVIDFASRRQAHVAMDIAKLERDIVFRVFDYNTREFFDWSRTSVWRSLALMNVQGRVFERGELDDLNPEARDALEFIAGLRTILKNESPTLQEGEYLIALLHYSLLAIAHPEISIPKKVFAVEYVDNLLKVFAP